MTYKIYVGIEVPTSMVDYSKISVLYEDGKAVDFDLDVSVNLFGIEFKVCADSLTDSAVDFLVEKKVEQDSERDCFCPETGRDFS